MGSKPTRPMTFTPARRRGATPAADRCMLLRSRVTLFLVPAFSAALSGRPARRVAAAPWRYAGREARAEFTLDGDTPYQYSSRAPCTPADLTLTPGPGPNQASRPRSSSAGITSRSEGSARAAAAVRSYVETKACVAGQRGPSGRLAEAARSLGQPEAPSGAESSLRQRLMLSWTQVRTCGRATAGPPSPVRSAAGAAAAARAAASRIRPTRWLSCSSGSKLQTADEPPY